MVPGAMYDHMAKVSNPTLEQFKVAFLVGNEAFNRGDFATAFAGLAPDCEWHPLACATERVLVGPGEVCVSSSRRSSTRSGTGAPTLLTSCRAGDGVFVVLLRGRGTGRASRAPTRVDLAEVWELREGVPARVREFPTWEEALSAAGLDPSTAADFRRGERSGG